MDKYIDWRLREWGKWARRGGGAGIGFKSSTIEAEMIEMGGVMIRGQGKKSSIDHDPRAEQVESIVSKMPKRLKRVAIVRYIKTGSPKDRAKMLHCSVAWYYQKVDEMHKEVKKKLEELRTQKINGETLADR